MAGLRSITLRACTEIHPPEAPNSIPFCRHWIDLVVWLSALSSYDSFDLIWLLVQQIPWISASLTVLLEKYSKHPLPSCTPSSSPSEAHLLAHVGAAVYTGSWDCRKASPEEAHFGHWTLKQLKQNRNTDHSKGGESLLSEFLHARQPKPWGYPEIWTVKMWLKLPWQEQLSGPGPVLPSHAGDGQLRKSITHGITQWCTATSRKQQW